MMNLNRRRGPDGRHAVFLQGADARAAMLVVVKHFIERAAELLHHASFDLAGQHQWVQHHAVVGHHPDFQDLNATGLDVDFH